jgi:hypothetical protein
MADVGTGERPRDLGIAGYRDFVRIGSGGYSTVYRAHQDLFDRDVAVKILSVHVVDDTARRRFRRECSAAGRISDHPNVATLLDAGFTAGGSPYITSEYCPGGSLADQLLERGPLPADEVVTLGIKLAHGLQAVHDAGVLHRDIKPANILVSSYDEPMLADFGIALAETGVHSTGANLATPYYTAPETLHGTPPSIAADVYSLSATLWELLSGRAPHAIDTPEPLTVMLARIGEDPLPLLDPSVAPPPLADLLRRGLSLDPTERPRTAGALAAELEALRPDPTPAAETADTAVVAAPDDGHDAATRAFARIPRPLLISAAVLVGVLAVIGLFAVLRGDEPEEADSAPSGPAPANQVASVLDLLGTFDLGGAEVHAELIPVSDDEGVIEIRIPVSWDETDTAGAVIDGQLAYGVTASDDLADFAEFAEASGAEVLVVTGVDPADPMALEAVLSEVGLPPDCEPTGFVDFDDGRSIGTAEAFEGCGDGDGVYVALLAGPPDGEVAVFIGALLQSDADAALVDNFIADVQGDLGGG